MDYASRLGLALLAVACSSKDGAGGTTSSGGSTSTGGATTSTVGTTATGGAVQTGGAAQTGGTTDNPSTTPTLVTSGPSAYWKTDGELKEVTSETADVTVNDASVAQNWDGFGAAFNEMGWNYLSMLSDADRDRAMNLLFSAEGTRFTWGRIPIGSTDYSMDRYSLDETPNDTSLANFSIERDKERLIPFAKAAQTIKTDLRFWASPWSPPTWMKDGPFNDSFAFDGGTMKTDTTILKTYAQYFVKFVQAYRDLGFKIEIVSPQNEPGFSGTYPACAWAPETYASFVGQHLGPALAAANLDTKIMLGTFNGGGGDTSIVSTVMGDAAAKSYITVFGYQWGMDANIASTKQYNIPIWQSEHMCGNYPWLSGFVADKAPNDQAYAVESWGMVRNWIKNGVTGYSVWNMVLDTVGLSIDSKRVWPQDALLTVDTSTKKLNITPAYYVFRHFAQFVSPGAKVVGTTGGDAVAFKNSDGSIVAVAYNSGAEKTMTVAIAGKKLQFTAPNNGWATVVAR
jgi:glucosylceramidase